MKILPDSQINNMPILEDVLEELRLNIIDHLQYIADAKYLYSLNSDELKQKLGLLGLTSINIGKFISLDLSQDIFRYISPEFYKMYRKLNQHRGNKMSMDYIFHSAGMMNTLVHSNDQYYNATNIFDDVGSFFDFNTFRDNQFPELEIGDGYIIVPYTSNKVQLLKQYLATNPIIFSFLPAGYTFIFLSDYRNSFDNGALQYDNVLNYLDNQEVLEYLKQLYWEPYEHYTAEEQIIYPNHPDDEVTYTHDLYYYDPIYFRDLGYSFFINNYSRFEDDSLYILPYGDDLYTFNTLEEYLAYYTMLLMDSVLTDYEHGLEADLNNPLFYKDVWVGDHLVSYLLGENVESEYPDHVKGLKAIQNPSYSYASLYDRGQSLASQYLQRENGIISKTDVLIQEHKSEIISDRREMDLFKIVFNDEYSLWLIAAYTPSQASLLLQNVMGIDANLADLIVSNMPSLIQNSLDYDVAEYYFNQLIQSLTSNDIIFEVRDNNDSVVLTNASQYNIHTEEITSNNYIPSYMASMNKVDLGSSTPITTYTLSYVNTQLPDITITMPSSSVGASGTVVTLPTMSGEYESGGKTWTPSTWDIGAFGSLYTITADTIAHLVFEEVEVEPYEEITLYFSSSSNFAMQGQITSGFTGDVNSAYIYRLYTDAEHTAPWNGYDYSHDYEIGYYSSGNWVKRPIVQEMPDSTTSAQNSVISWILLDTGYVWGVSNINTSSETLTFKNGSITVRIYRKDQQYYAGYFNTSSVYNNTSMVYNSAYNMNGSPNTGSHGIGYSIDNMPDENLSGFYGSGGNLVSSRYNNFAWRSGSPLGVVYYNTNDGTLSIRNVLYTLSQPTFYGWTNPDGDSTHYTVSKNYLKNKNYTNVLANKAFRYYPIALFKYDGSCADDTSGHYVNSSNLGIDPSYPNYLCFTESYGTISLSRVWYRKEYWGEPVELELWYSSSFNNQTFSANDYWFSYFKTSAMEDTASQFGIAIDSSSSTHQLSRNNIVGFEYEILGLYKADGTTQVTADLSNFYVGTRSASQSLLIKNIAAFSTQSAMWKVRVWKYTPYNGYLAENGAQGTTDTTLPSSRTYLRDSIGNAIEWDSTVDYEIKLGLTYNMTVVDIPNDIFIQKYNNYVSVYVPSSLANTITAFRIIYAKHSKNEFWLDGVFGTPTEIPVGFTVDYIMCDRVYLHIDSISYSGNVLSLSVNGANEYFTDTNTSLLALGANPYIDVFIFTSDTAGNFLTYGASHTPDSYNPSSLTDKQLNSYGKCVYFTATFATVGRAQEYYEENAGTRLIQLRKFDQYNKIVRYYFKIQQSLWQMQGDYIQWLGDTTDPADPANHYNGKNMLLHCVRVQS